MKNRNFCLILLLLLLSVGRTWAADRSVTSFPTVTPESTDNIVITDTSAGGAFAKTAPANLRPAMGLGTSDNPAFNSVNLSSGNIAAANTQVTKKWFNSASISYTADITSVIHGGHHFICKATHAGNTANSEPGVGSSWTTYWKYAGEVLTTVRTTAGGGSTTTPPSEAAVGDALAGKEGTLNATGIVAKFASGACSGYLKSDGSCDTPAAGGTDDQTASEVPFTPNGSIAATTVQAAIQEVRDEAGGSAVTDATITTTDVTTNNASTSKHGWAPKATAPAAGLYNYLGITNGETAYTNKALFNATAPSTQAFGDSASVGTATAAARQDHKHAMMATPTASTVGLSGLATTAITGNLTLSKTGTTARTATFPDASGTVALTSDITGTNSGTNTGDNATNTQYSGLITSKTANYVYAAPNGSAGVPAFRSLVAADVPTLNQTTTGTAAGLTAQYVDWNSSSGGPSIANKPSIVSPLSTVRTTAGGGSTTAASQEAAIGDALALKAPAANPTFTGTVTVPALTGATYSGNSLVAAVQAALTANDNAVDINASAYMLTMLDDADAAAARTTLGVTSPTAPGPIGGTTPSTAVFTTVSADDIIIAPPPAGETGEIGLKEAPANGTNEVILKAPAALAGNVTITLPSGVVPASATATCTAGQWWYDASYWYVCTGTNTWNRAALATW